MNKVENWLYQTFILLYCESSKNVPNFPKEIGLHMVYFPLYNQARLKGYIGFFSTELSNVKSKLHLIHSVQTHCLPHCSIKCCLMDEIENLSPVSHNHDSLLLFVSSCKFSLFKFSLFN